MSDNFAATSCSINVFPFEGGPLSIQGGQIKSVTVTKSIRGGSEGTVVVELAPGGPFGPESSPTWSEVITPMSHILVGMTRGSRAGLVMDGVVTKAGENQEWRTSDRGSFAMRTPIIEGSDFSWFFRSFNWYVLTFFGLTQGAAIGQAYGGGATGLAAALDQGLLGGTNPADVAQRWYDKVMSGADGILGKTFVPYQNSTRIPFRDALRTAWEAFPNAIVPVGDFFMAVEGTWMAKFLSLLPMPWYEFFVTTAPVGAYAPPSSAKVATTPGTQFAISGQTLIPPSGPVLVARINPIPVFNATATVSSSAPAFTQLDMSRWNALQVFTLGNHGFIDSEIEFDAEGARNFYQLNPTALSLNYALNNANNIPFYFSMMGATDPASIHRYGYRPDIGTFRWLYDPQGAAAQNGEINYPLTIALLLARQISWSHPTPLMAKAAVVAPLMPDVLVGTRFRYAPYKDGTLWDFYIESVRHRFVFGGESTTTLSLSRGLPSSVYADSSDAGVLRNIYLGNAQRLNGSYVSGLPAGTGPALTPFGTPESITAAMANMAKIFVTPQPPSQ